MPLYTLARGMTPAAIADIAFDATGHWVAATSCRGTAHVFAVNLTGGPVELMTHGVLPIGARARTGEAMLPLHGRSACQVRTRACVYVRVCMCGRRVLTCTDTDGISTSTRAASPKGPATSGGRCLCNGTLPAIVGHGCLEWAGIQ